MAKVYVIQSQDACSRDRETGWHEWESSDDPVELLRSFVAAVSGEEIDDVNLYWRVVEVDE
jgi:hypothetical protein